MVKPNSPCKACEKRSAGCHATCDEYGAYKADLSAWRCAIIDAKAKEADVNGVLIKGAKNVNKYGVNVKKFNRNGGVKQ